MTQLPNCTDHCSDTTTSLRLRRSDNYAGIRHQVVPSQMKSTRLVFARLVVGITLAILIAGCSEKPSAVPIPEWDPPGFASIVLAELDKNGNSLIDKVELAKAPRARVRCAIYRHKR